MSCGNRQQDDNEDDDDDANDDDASLLQGLDELRATRREVVNKLREQTALKQTLMELDDQNLQNKIEINKLKVGGYLCVGEGVGTGDAQECDSEHCS